MNIINLIVFILFNYSTNLENSITNHSVYPSQTPNFDKKLDFI